MKENTIEFCSCGKVKGHKNRCGSIKMRHKEHIGKYSGKSKSEFAFNEYK